MQTKHTSSSILRTIAISLLLTATAIGIQAQHRQKAYAAAPDTIPLFCGMEVSFDIVGVAQRLLSDYGQYEGSLRINLKDKYFPVVEVGWGSADAEDVTTHLSYKTSAPYGRIGCDFNLMKNKHERYRVYAGFRYALTSFKYDLFSPGIEDPTWKEHVAYQAEGVSCYYHWLEGAVGVDAWLWGPLRLGWSVRYKRRLLHDEGPLGNAWYVPGYGKQGNSRLGGTFHITLEI